MWFLANEVTAEMDLMPLTYVALYIKLNCGKYDYFKWVGQFRVPKD
jgi:hypothetical protein